MGISTEVKTKKKKIKWNLQNKNCRIEKYNTSIPHFISLCLLCVTNTVWFFFCLFLFFNKLRVCGNTVEQVCRHHFSNSICSFTSLSHISIILAIFQAFSLLTIFVMVISDLWCYCNCFGTPRIAVLINKLSKCCMFWLLHWPAISPSLSLSLVLHILWDNTSKKIDLLKAQMMVSIS